MRLVGQIVLGKINAMKISCIILLLAVATSANCQPKSEIKKLSWLAGEWTSTNPKPGLTAYETWTISQVGELGGAGVTMNGKDTVFIEKFRITSRDGNLYYVADVPENKARVYFLLTEITGNGFTCENPQHDFPKKIVYLKDGKHLKATISGDGKSRDFLFVKK
jgi:hypothetical protein